MQREIQMVINKLDEMKKTHDDHIQQLSANSIDVTKKIHSIQIELFSHLYTSTFLFKNFQKLYFLTSSFSILLWIKVHSFHAFNGIIGCGEDATQDKNKCFHAYLRNKKPYFGFWDNDIASDTELLPDVWTHVSFTYDINSSTGSIFINGKLDTKKVGMAPLLVAHSMVFGHSHKPHNSLDG
eukprot:gene14201-15701_t